MYYLFAIPIIDLVIITIMKVDDLFVRFITIPSFIIVFLNIYLLNYLVTSIIREAHNCYSFLNSLIARKALPLRLKFKIISLIERLSGPVIGIYCWDLFPFTNYEFVMFIINCIMTFILFMGLFK